MKKKLTNDDKALLKSVARNKSYDVGYGLLVNDVRGETFDYIMQGAMDVKYESHKQREEWLAGAMERMDERLSPEAVIKIREDSACCLGGERAELAKKFTIASQPLRSALTLSPRPAP